VLEPVVVLLALGRRQRAWAGPHQPPPRGGQRQRGPLGQAGDPVAIARGLAAEDDPPARAQHAAELGEGGVEVRQVVQHGVAEDEVERVVGERERVGLALRGLHAQAEPARGVLELGQHPE
jgi:hypothetical protein